jgi:hypothetical protein
VHSLDPAVTDLPLAWCSHFQGRDPNDINELPNIEEQPVYEIYRIRHPTNKYSTRGVILGEGKPENQNHATIFAHHEGIQAIDMNQDGYLCEW